MTYRGFHYRVTLPLLALCYALWNYVSGAEGVALPLLALNVIVVLFTFPWDNNAIRWGVWDFPDDRLLLRLDRLPIEELAFFVLQTLQVSFLTLAFCAINPRIHDFQPQLTIGTLSLAGVMFLLWIVVGISTQSWRKRNRQVTYAWHLLYWFSPVIIVQWIIAGDLLSARYNEILAATFTIGTILSVSDVWAVRKGVWYFDHSQVTGHYVAKILPWEEVAFFYTTSLLVSQSILLLAPQQLR